MEDREFIRALREQAKKFENLEDSQPNIENFFAITEARDALPPEASGQIVEAFLASTIFLIAHKKNTQSVIRAIRLMLKYLRHDPSVFARLKPNKILLRKMNLERHFMSEESDYQASLELASFLLRYHADIDYGDFTDDPFCIQKLRRYEDVKYAAEVEGITKSLEALTDKFYQIQALGLTNDTQVASQQQEKLKHRVRYLDTQPTMFKNPLDQGGKEAILALEEIDNLKRTVNVQLTTLKESLDGEIERQVALQMRDFRDQYFAQTVKDNNPNNSYKKALELMLEVEQKLDARVTSFQSEIKTSITKIIQSQNQRELASERNDKLLYGLEQQLATDVVQKLAAIQSQVDQVKNDVVQCDQNVVETQKKHQKLQSTIKEYVDLIEVLNEKTGLQSDALIDMRQGIQKKIGVIENQVLEKLDMTKGVDMQEFLRSFDDTINKIEYDVEVLSKDQVVMRDQLASEIREAMQTIAQTRQDYIERMNSMYKDQANIINMFNENNKNIAETLKHETSRASQTFKMMKQMMNDYEAKIIQNEQLFQRQVDDVADLQKAQREVGERCAVLANQIGSLTTGISNSSKKVGESFTRIAQEFELKLRGQEIQLQKVQGIAMKADANFQRMSKQF